MIFFVFAGKHVETWVAESGVVTLIDWYAQGVCFRHVTLYSFFDVVRGERVLRFERQNQRWRYPLLSTCVGIAKHVAGIRSWAITADQLYRDLIKAGAREVTPDGCEKAVQDAGRKAARSHAIRSDAGARAPSSH